MFQDNSKWRRHYLNSLYDYMQDCEKEVGYMREEQNKILKQDWSDQMVDHADVRRQYEVSKLGFELIVWLIQWNELKDWYSCRPTFLKQGGLGYVSVVGGLGKNIQKQKFHYESSINSFKTWSKPTSSDINHIT